MVGRWVAQGREYTKSRQVCQNKSLSWGIQWTHQQPYHYSTANMTRLKNEAECIEFIKMSTTIPGPEVVTTYERDGSFFSRNETHRRRLNARLET
jgi:hypothetical protein